MNRPARLAVAVISAGRVGAVLGAALRAAGHTIAATCAVSTASQRRAEDLLPGVPILPPDEAAAAADLVLLAIPDDALHGTVRGLLGAGALRAGQIVVHTSGAHGVGTLAPVTEAGGLALALHPVMTFTGRPEDLDRLATCCFGITAAGDSAEWSVAEAIVVEMGAEPVRIPEDIRALYHAALVHGSNHLIALVTDAAKVLRDGGVDDPQRLLGPLLSASLDNALRLGDRALTGPVARADTETLRAHLGVLREIAPETVAAYRELARRAADCADRAGMHTPQARAAVLATLAAEGTTGTPENPANPEPPEDGEDR